ncbi:MAG: small multidrug resistance pump [Arenicella sp.]|jgi:small multidrug resistance pump
MIYWYLAIAIIAEVVGTIALKASDGFTQAMPATIVVIAYATAFYFLSLVLKTMPVGIVYALWSGMGIVFITIISTIVFKQVPDAAAIVGMSLIVLGVVVINVFSKTVAH